MEDSKYEHVHQSGSLGVTTRPYNIVLPPKPKWELRIVAGEGPTFRLVVAPNRFHRFMQRVVFGFSWKEISHE